MPRTHPHSWPQTLTDWCVIQAFEKAGCPGCLRKPPGLAAAFVIEVAEVIRFHTFSLRAVQLVSLRQSAAEMAYKSQDGETYRQLCQSLETAEEDLLSSLTSQSLGEIRRARHEQCQVALDEFRSRHAAAAIAAERRCTRAYWAAARNRWLQPDLFACLDPDHPVPRLAAHTPVWWALFVRCLRTEFSRRDLTSYQLLGELPRLRRQARQDRKIVLTALVEDWRTAHAEELGLPARLHYHVLESRGQARARFVRTWFKARNTAHLECHVDFQARRGLLEQIDFIPTGAWSAN